MKKFTQILRAMGVAVFVIAVVVPPTAARALPAWLEQVSVSLAEVSAQRASSTLSLSADGRYVAFKYYLDPFYFPGQVIADYQDRAVVYDTVTGATVVASVGAEGVPASAYVGAVDTISADGRYVFFQSASSLTPDAPSSCSSLCSYRRDMIAGVTTFINHGFVVASRDGNAVVYLSGNGEVYYHNISQASTTQLTVWEDKSSGLVGMNNDGSLMGVTTTAFSSDQFVMQTYIATTNGQPVGVPDTIAQVLGMPAWSQNPKPTDQTSDLSITVTDDATSVTAGEYFFGDNDPGQGNGVPLALMGGTLTATFGTDLQPDIYKINIRAQDGAGNWSAPITDNLVV